MSKLKLGPIEDEKPVKLSIELPAQVYRDLADYAAALARQGGADTSMEPVKLVAPMLARFMATDRAFARARRKPDQAAAEPTRATIDVPS